MSEHDQAALRLTAHDLRALLDLSYERERGLLSAVNGLLSVLETAAVAPDQEERARALREEASALRARMASQPVRNHGLFAELCRLQVELTGTRRVNATLVNTIAEQRNDLEKLNRMLSEHRLGYAEAVATRDACVALLNSPEMTLKVIEAARSSVR